MEIKIDLSDINTENIKDLYKIYKKDKIQFHEHLEKSKKIFKDYKTKMISKLHNYLFIENNYLDIGINLSNFNKDEQLKLCLIPFITPIKKGNKNYGFKKDGKYMSINIDSIDNYDDYDYVLNLHMKPKLLFNYCIKTIKLFNNAFYKKPHSNMTYNSKSKPRLIYQYGF